MCLTGFPNLTSCQYSFKFFTPEPNPRINLPFEISLRSSAVKARVRGDLRKARATPDPNFILQVFVADAVKGTQGVLCNSLVHKVSKPFFSPSIPASTNSSKVSPQGPKESFIYQSPQYLFQLLETSLYLEGHPFYKQRRFFSTE